MKNTFLVKSLGAAAVGLLLTAAAAQAQTGTSGGPSPITTPDPTAVPLDGGASLLLASGVALGLKKLRSRRRTR